MEIKKGSIVTQYMENIECLNNPYSLMYIGQVVDIIGSTIVLDPTIMGYKVANMDDYIMYKVEDKGGIEEEITPNLRIIEPHEFEHYMLMLDKKPVDLDLFNRKLSAALIKANEQILPKE